MAHIVMLLMGDIRYDGRVRKEIRTLLVAGHQVELVVSDFDKSGTGGGDLGVRIHYIPMTLWPNPALNFLEQLSFNRKAASIIRDIGPTHIHCHDLSSLLAGVWSKRKVNGKVIFDAHELMPESMGGMREKIWGYIERKCVNSCDSIVMPEKNRIAYFQKKYPHAPSIWLLENFPRQDEISFEKNDFFREKYPIRKNQKIVLYTGFLAARRHIEDLIYAMAICTEQFILVALGYAFKGYDKVLQKMVNKLRLADRIFIHRAVPHVDLLKYMSACDIGIALYRNSNLNNFYCASNKLYEYIALDKPVVTNDYPGLLERVERFGQGICLAEITPRSLADAFTRAADPKFIKPGMKKYFWEDQENILIQLYER
jgi:glycosyltransferase involved in cell wall biosynthesis